MEITNNSELYLGNDELKIYRGEDFKVSEKIIIHQPSLGEICDFGEKEYYSMVYGLTATPASLKVQLWDIGIDYTKIQPYELFYNILFKTYSVDKTKLLFGDLDLSKFEVMQRKINEETSIVLYNNDEENPIIIDELTYNIIIDYICKAHYIERDFRKPANKSTKLILIEDEREQQAINKNKEYHSQLKNLVSAMINSEGFKYGHNEVWNMKINAFMDSVKRIQKIKDASLLLQSGYSGFGIDLKKISKSQLNWIGELD